MDPYIFENTIESLVKIRHKRGRGECVDANPVVSLLHPIKACEDCGLHVQGRRVEFYVKGWDKKDPFWIKQCSVCNLRTRLGEYRRK